MNVIPFIVIGVAAGTGYLINGTQGAVIGGVLWGVVVIVCSAFSANR